MGGVYPLSKGSNLSGRWGGERKRGRGGGGEGEGGVTDNESKP